MIMECFNLTKMRIPINLISIPIFWKFLEFFFFKKRYIIIIILGNAKKEIETNAIDDAAVY